MSFAPEPASAGFQPYQPGVCNPRRRCSYDRHSPSRRLLPCPRYISLCARRCCTSRTMTSAAACRISWPNSAVASCGAIRPPTPMSGSPFGGSRLKSTVLGVQRHHVRSLPACCVIACHLVAISDQEVVHAGPGQHPAPLAELALVELKDGGAGVVHQRVVAGHQHAQLEAEGLGLCQDVEEQLVVVQRLFRRTEGLALGQEVVGRQAPSSRRSAPGRVRWPPSAPPGGSRRSRAAERPARRPAART